LSFFISFEGGEGSGKTTQAEILSVRLRDAGLPVLLIHEPGSTPLGTYLRDWLKREGTISREAELLLFAAARAELVAKVIKPALEEKKVVIADRYADSTMAYQGYGRRISFKYVRMINDLATQGILPNLTFLIDCPPEQGLERLGSMQMRLALESSDRRHLGRLEREGTRRFEEETLNFHRRVRKGYLEMASRNPDKWCVVDGTRTVEQVSAEIWDRAQNLLTQGTPEQPTEPALDYPNSDRE